MRRSIAAEAVPKCDKIKAELMAGGVQKRCRATNSRPESFDEAR